MKLNSKSKLFCQCQNVQDFENLTPNTHICEVCTGQPGAMPVLSKGPLTKALVLGKALGCTIEKESTFDRKSYFYPDLPMGYQITQQFQPTCIDGSVSFFVDKEFKEEKTVGIRDAHIETDTGKTIHQGGKAALDYNRSCTPLVEVVTHPDFRSGEEVISFLKELKRRAVYNNVSKAELESGQMRVDVNLSLREKGSTEYGVRCELKNMNSYSAILRAIDFEVIRQSQLLDSGEVVAQETRRRDDQEKQSFVMRSKEDAMDYRYIPEPDLPQLVLSQEQMLAGEAVLIPFDLIGVLKNEYSFNKEYINALIESKSLFDYFTVCIEAKYDPKSVATRLVGPIQRRCKEQEKTIDSVLFTQDSFLSFLEALKQEKITNNQAKTVIAEMLLTGSHPEKIIEEKGFKPISKDQIVQWVSTLLEEHSDIKEQLLSGNMKPLGFVTGQIMKISGGSANPKIVKDVINELTTNNG